MTGIRDFARRFDTNIDVLLSDTGEFGQAL
jgi:hypothetical protein